MAEIVRVEEEEEVGELVEFLHEQDLDYPNFHNWVEKVGDKILEPPGNQDRFGLLAYDGEEPVGDIIVKEHDIYAGIPVRECEVKNLYVDEEHKGQGIGKELLESATEVAEERYGMSRLVADTHVSNKEVRKYLEEQGFELLGTRDLYGREGEEAVYAYQHRNLVNS